MNSLISQMQIQVNDKIFLKDPNSSELGKKIISNGIQLIDEMGLENFHFQKTCFEAGDHRKLYLQVLRK